MLKAVIFDFGHTIMNELHERHVALANRSIQLMPGIPEILPAIPLAKGIWANTQRATAQDIRYWLERAGINRYFQWVVTSMEAGVRKPDAQFFSFALDSCSLQKNDVLFVGNQLNTDIQGASSFGIRSVWLYGRTYRSPDDTSRRHDVLRNVRPTYVIPSLKQLPGLVQRIRSGSTSLSG